MTEDKKLILVGYDGDGQHIEEVPGDPPAIRAELSAELKKLPEHGRILYAAMEAEDQTFGCRKVAEREPESPLRAGCNCQCCDHSEGTDCACDCHLNGACGIALVEVAWHRKRLKDVRAEEREACAKIADSQVPMRQFEDPETRVWDSACRKVAAAIRDRETT